MIARVLVAYVTRAGSTAGVATAIAETPIARGSAVGVAPIAEGPSVWGYQGAMIGSAIQGGQRLPEAIAFVRDNQQARSRPLPAPAPPLRAAFALDGTPLPRAQRAHHPHRMLTIP